jgi:hypothetical protein
VRSDITYPTIPRRFFLTLHNVHYRLYQKVGCNLVLVKRFLTSAALASIVLLSSSAASSGASGLNNSILSFNFSENTSAPVVNQPYEVIVDVTPTSASGLITIAAYQVPRTTASGHSALTVIGCASQAVSNGQVSCMLRFPSTGRWHVSAEFRANHALRNVIHSSTSLQVFGSA